VLISKPLTTLILGAASIVSVAMTPSTESAARTNTNNTANQHLRAYGRSVAISGDWAFVGEPNVGGRGGGPPAAGVVHIYRKNAAGVWTAAGELTAANPAPNDGFGVSLATDGSALLVGQVTPPPAPTLGRGAGGAPQIIPGGPDTTSGSVQLFKKGADSKWSAAGSLPGSKVAAQFGGAVLLSGDVALVGAPAESNNGGTVYTFKRAKDGSWSATGALPAQGVTAGDRFGSAIAMDGDRAAVGSPTRKAKGSLFIFKRDSAGAWTQESEQAAPNNLPDNAFFGAAVAVKGDRVIAGAPGTNFNPTVLPNPAHDPLLNAIAAGVTGTSR